MSEFPKRIPEKLKAIRERLKLSPDQLAPKVGAKTGAEILAYDVVGLCETRGHPG